MTTPAGDGKCGRPTRAGTPCKITRASAAGWYTALRAEGPACRIHLTPAEWEIFGPAAEAVEADEQRAMLAYHQEMPVACWDWPVSDDDRRRAAESWACTDPEQAHEIAWNLLADWQDDRCAICKAVSDVLDHDHATGLVRGWLCVRCNIGEGTGGLIPGGRFERYREKNPASILGVELRYYSPFAGLAEPQPPSAVDLDRSPGYLLATYLADGE